MKAIIDQIRNAYDTGDEDKANNLKRKLPSFIFMVGDMKKSRNNAGVEDCWRTDDNVTKLNGLIMLDIDHVSDPRSLFEAYVSPKFFAGQSGIAERGDDRGLNEGTDSACSDPQPPNLGGSSILLVHVTPKGHGLRIVFRGMNDLDIAENQRQFAEHLGLEYDEVCKNPSRMSFACTKEDILYMNDEIFDYQDEEFNRNYQEHCPADTGRNCGNATHGDTAAALSDGTADGRNGAAVEENNGDASTDAGETRLNLEVDNDGNPVFEGVPFATIIEEYWRQDGGRPVKGTRHTRVLALAGRLRYICDNDPRTVLRVIDGCDLPRRELEQIVADACAAKMAPFIPPKFRKVLQSVGIKGLTEKERGAGHAEGKPDAVAEIDYQAWWQRLRPLLCDGLSDAVAGMPEEIRLGGVLAAGAMFGTYLTRCHYQHYDGKKARLNFLVYIIGNAATGKGFLPDMDELIMEPMRAADEAGRQMEKRYKEDMEQRSGSSKKQKEAAMDVPHAVVRYCPTSISNAQLYTRFDNAKETIDGEQVQLHLYTCEAELATAIRAQVGSWAGKLDLELKSFHNEYCGVDYKNNQSANGIYQVCWNQVTSGTPDAVRKKIKPEHITDGFVTRLALFIMPERNFEVIDFKDHTTKNHDAETRLRSWGYKLEKLHGELICPRLIRFAYDWMCARAEENRQNNDKVSDYFRKRVPIYMVNYGLVHCVLRDYHHLSKLMDEGKPLKLRITQQDLDFAELIGDFLYYMQIRQYGTQIKNALENQSKDFIPMERKSKYDGLYHKLPETFTLKDVMNVYGVSNNAASQHCFSLSKRGYIKRIKQGTYQKVVK